LRFHPEKCSVLRVGNPREKTTLSWTTVHAKYTSKRRKS
jgi:hypothetical protein